MLDALRRSKLDPINPTMIIAHTIKGWGLDSYAHPGNHNALPDESEVEDLLESEGLTAADPFQVFDADSEEGKFLAARRTEMREGQEQVWALADRNRERFDADAKDGIPETIGVNLKYLPLVHTQYVWGQLAAKLIRIGNAWEPMRGGNPPKEPLEGDELRWGPAADMILTMAPDVGTSTNINPAMDDRIYGPEQEDHADALGVSDRRRPKLAPHEDAWARHIRFEIAEANCMSAVGAFGKMEQHVGVPFLPVMTVYDFFIKRAFDQLYYNLYWGSSFICVGTPSGVTLAPEGAQHSWKSDIAMPNVIIWEPFFAIEVDWVLADAVRRHYLRDNAGRSGVIIRAVTRAFRQAEMMTRLKEAVRFAGWSDEDILEATRKDALEGAYYLVDHRGKPGYEPGENVVHVFTMGAMGSEALAASDRLLAEGIYANVIVVTCGDLLVGNLGHANGYRHLLETLQITGDLHVTRATNGAGNGGVDISDRGDLVTVAGPARADRRGGRRRAGHPGQPRERGRGEGRGARRAEGLEVRPPRGRVWLPRHRRGRGLRRVRPRARGDGAGERADLVVAGVGAAGGGRRGHRADALAAAQLMRVLVQRVREARVRVDGEIVGEIGRGLLLFVGIKDDDTDDHLAWMAKKCAQLRIFADAEDKMNQSVVDIAGGALVVSQFTLYGNAKKGNRPSFIEAGRPDYASACCDRFAEMMRSHLDHVATGVFGANMQVELVNDGPVTIWLER